MICEAVANKLSIYQEFQALRLKTIMNRYFQSVSPSAALGHAQDLMRRGNFRHLPVIDETDHTLAGILTEGDIARYLSQGSHRAAKTAEDAVQCAMNPIVLTAGPDNSLNEAAARMAANEVSCLPITKYGKVIGLVTLTDVVAAQVRTNLVAGDGPGPHVSDVMTRKPLTVHPNDHILDAAARMAQYHVRHLPVVNGDRHVVGMLSDADIRDLIGDPSIAFSERSNVSARFSRVSDAMRRPAFLASEKHSCVTAARALIERHASAVPVVDDRNQLIGIVSYLDLLRGFANQLDKGMQGQSAMP
jgi:CBS domain-containing protein